MSKLFPSRLSLDFIKKINLVDAIIKPAKWAINVFINCRISISKTYYQLKFIQSKPFRKKIICFIKQSQIFQNKCVFREVVVRRCSVEKIFLKISQNSKESTCARISRPQACNFIKKETLAQVLSFEFCKIS